MILKFPERWRFGAFLKYLLYYKTASRENILPVYMCLAGLFSFIKVKRYFIFGYVYLTVFVFVLLSNI